MAGTELVSGNDIAHTVVISVVDGNSNTATCDVTVTGSVSSPDVPTVSLSSNSICSNEDVTITISGNLNDAIAWVVYTGSCGGTQIGTTSSSTFVVNLTTTTRFYVRGEGGCITLGSCGTATVTVNPLPTITFSTTEAEVCFGDVLASFAYSAITGSPDQYSVDFDVAAEGEGFVDVTNVALPVGVIDIAVPTAGTPATYNALLTVRNSTTGCVSGTINITVLIHPLPDTSEIITN
ncbi:MAG: hypothetical protein HQ521_11335 [Bacteroidetes bacterium]|nr:hypothetical protein [Bacteroidota bacterium]